jgi:hypothetical protein
MRGWSELCSCLVVNIFQGYECGAIFIYHHFCFSGGGRKNVATTVSIEIERLAEERKCVC